MAAPSRAQGLTVLDEDELRGRSRADVVFESLRDAIWTGRIASGERVREEEIARNLGVSRTPVREALQRLQQRGLLVVGPRGLAVSQLSTNQVIELYAMREILEGSAARLAAQHATDIEISILHRLQRELQQVSDDANAVVMLNRRFHQAIYEATHNRYLVQTLDVLHDSLALLNNTTFKAPKRAETDKEHRQIVLAIEKRDPDQAEAAARRHIRNGQLTRFERRAVLRDE
jgi:DNA-binding GntR family transcriptional regulator